MFYFLGIVAEEDVQKGFFVPSYTLCQSQGESINRSGWRVAKAGSTVGKLNKLLVKSLVGNDIMIEFMSRYRTRDHMHGDRRYKHEKTMKYYPKGSLFWFACNEYGERCGPAVFIKNVPDKHSVRDGGFAAIKAMNEQVISIKEVLSREPLFLDMKETCVKPKLYQERRPQGDYKSINM